MLRQKRNKGGFIEIFVCENCGSQNNEFLNNQTALTFNPTESPIPRPINNTRGTSSMQKSTQIKLNPSPKSVLTSAKVPEKQSKPSTTAEIHSKATSPTLVEFQNKNAQLPDWRLQLKNAVKQRKIESGEDFENISNVQTISAAPVNEYPTNGGNALKAEIIEEAQPEKIDNSQLANALRRIERSRQQYYIVEPIASGEIPLEDETEEKSGKDFPFTIAARNDNPTPESREELETSAKPTLVPNRKTAPAKNLNTQPGDSLYDTSELDPNFIPAKVASSFEKTPEADKATFAESATKTLPETKKETKGDITVEQSVETKDSKVIEATISEDIAPLALRFNAGLFDLIIGTFSGMILLSPFMLLGGSWMTIAGALAFLVTCAIVMFLYLTTTIGLFGKTFGMHLLSLEMIDYRDEEYPTFHQAAVSSSIYLLSLAFFGLGFVTSFFDEDRRAIHDLVSETLVVKEM